MPTMTRFILSAPLVVLVLAASFVAPAAAQEEAASRYTYAAYHSVPYQHMEAFLQSHFEHVAPVMEALVEEGVIESWNLTQHHTGGEHNLRMSMTAGDWAAFRTFWDQFFQRVDSAAFAETGGMIAHHTDEIWAEAARNVPEDPAPTVTLIYESMFEVAWARMGEFQALFMEKQKPLLDELVSEGLLQGYIVQTHDTGGDYNWKIRYLFDEWDDIDDAMARQMAAGAEDPNPNEGADMIQAHTDIIWSVVTPPGM